MGPCPRALYSLLSLDLADYFPTLKLSQLDSSEKIEPWPGISPKQVKCLQLRSSILKKYEGNKAPDADSLALDKFLESNSRCERFSLQEASSAIEEIAINEAKVVFQDFFESYFGGYWLTPERVSAGMLPGPGASIKATGDSFYHKIAASPMTGTSRSLFLLYRREAAKYSLWDETEKIRSDHLGSYVAVRGNALSFVPKTSEISRTICTEPLLNMLVQKGIGAAFEEELKKRFGIDLSIQPSKNQLLALKGSLEGTYGTIDLSCASDSISLKLLEAICPSYILGWLKESRSPITKLPNGSEVALHMVSSMGNAFTFPLQTILFSSIVIGVYKALDIKVCKPRGKRLGNFAVFGDDIIVRREAYDLVVRCLQLWGFVVNADKSFNNGPFRESCGADFWLGHNVRGVYCKTLCTKQDTYSLINRLNDWSAENEVPLLNTIQYLLEHVKFLPVPPWDSDIAGVKVPLNFAAPLFRDRNTGSILYFRYQPRQAKISLLNVGLQSRIPRSKALHNAPGILLTAVAGYVRDGAIIERQRRVSYFRRAAISPCWDYWDSLSSRLSLAGWHRWVTIYAALNLGKV
jgi:hypothetical protein